MISAEQLRRAPRVDLIRSPAELLQEARRAAREAFLRAETERLAQPKVRRGTGRLRIVASA